MGDYRLYAEARRNANKVVYAAQKETVNEKSGQEIFKISKQMQKSNQDVVGEQCVRDDTGTLACTEEPQKKRRGIAITITC